MAFDPKKHLIKIQGNREYLPVAARLVWFRGEHPDWGIVTSPVEINMERQYAIFSCQIFNADGKLMATATKMENIRGFGDFLEKAETGSVGRALAYCGYGTQFAPELEEESRFADAPYPPTGSALLRSGSAPTSGYASQADGNGNGASVPDANPDSNECTVSGCFATLTDAQTTMSKQKFGRRVCLRHQKDGSVTPSSAGSRASSAGNPRDFVAPPMSAASSASSGFGVGGVR